MTARGDACDILITQSSTQKCFFDDYWYCDLRNQIMPTLPPSGGCFCLAAANELKSFRNMPASEILAEFLRLIFLVIAGRLFRCNEISFSDVFAKAKRRGGFSFPRCLFALRQKQTETILNIFSAASSSKWKTTTFFAVDMMLISKRQKLSNMMHVINKPRRKREWWESL